MQARKKRACTFMTSDELDHEALLHDIILAGEYSLLGRWFLAAFAVTVVGMCMNFYFVNYMPVRIGVSNTFKIMSQSLKNILHLNQPIYAKKDKGYYYNLCQNSTGAYGDLHEELRLNLVSNIIYVAGILAFITYIHWSFGIFFAVYGVVLAIISVNGAKPLYTMQKDILEVQDGYWSKQRNIIENKGGINALHAEDFFEFSFESTSDKYEKHVLKYRFFEYLCQYLPSFANQISNIAFLLMAAYLVMRGSITTGTLIMGYQYIGYFAAPISTICSILMRAKSNRVHIERVDELEEESQAENENIAHATQRELLADIRDVDFAIGSGEEKFLYHIDRLQLKKNGLYVIKGENGSGKSMFMNLLLGNVSYENVKGEFTISEDINRTAFLTYPIFTVNGSFEDNLFGIEEDNALADILRIDFADKEISESPINLSYGQQQKLALMRVFGLNAPIVFLDEPLSNLDVETQEALISYICELKGKKTILAVMHSDELDGVADGVIEIHDKRMELR